VTVLYQEVSSLVAAWYRWTTAASRANANLLNTEIVLLSVAVFVFNLNFQMGAAAGIAYVIPILNASRARSVSLIFLAAGACSILSAIGLLGIGPGNFANTLLDLVPPLFVIWMVAVFLGDRIRSENSVSASELRMRAITDSVPGAVYQFLRTPQGDNELLLMSRGIEGILEAERAPLNELFEQIYAAIVEDDQCAYLDSIATAAKDCTEWSHDFRQRMPDGALKWVHGNSIPEAPQADGSIVFNGLLQDITAARNLSEELTYQAQIDTLTGLVNRRSFEQHLHKVLESVDKTRSDVVLAYLDLDQFKVINDTCGHNAGDDLLRQLATLLSSLLRGNDMLARLGGDEFGILMTSASMPQAHAIMNRIREKIADFRFAWEGRTFSIGVSIGLVPIDAQIENISQALKHADAACYAAKDAGRNRIHIYHHDDSYLSHRHSEMQWVARINHALECDAFELHAQRIVRILDPQSANDHYEILIRMRNDDGTCAPPGAFLPAAERYNLSTKIDRWVVKHLFEWLASNRHMLERAEQYCVNLSALSLGDEGTLTFIVAEFAAWDIPAAKIGFEVTETATITNLSDATHFINTLKALGCRFSARRFWFRHLVIWLP
jgi:diguanylate cyclase (GGDEF)-like protein